MNSDPYKARLALVEIRKTGDVEELRAILWYAINRVGVFLNSDDPALVIRATHCLAQVSPAYLKALEVGEIESRIAAIEAKVETQ